jgi:hypothetical protein
VTDSRIKGRVKGLFGGASADDDIVMPPANAGTCPMPTPSGKPFRCLCWPAVRPTST